MTCPFREAIAARLLSVLVCEVLVICYVRRGFLMLLLLDLTADASEMVLMLLQIRS